MSFKNPFSKYFQIYKKTDAIRGPCVDRFNYAVQLINEGSNKNLVKAYAWLSLAADEIDMKLEATRIKHQIQYKLKQFG
jgi:hypothetical protein